MRVKRNNAKRTLGSPGERRFLVAPAKRREISASRKSGENKRTHSKSIMDISSWCSGLTGDCSTGSASGKAFSPNESKMVRSSKAPSCNNDIGRIQRLDLLSQKERRNSIVAK